MAQHLWQLAWRPVQLGISVLFNSVYDIEYMFDPKFDLDKLIINERSILHRKIV